MSATTKTSIGMVASCVGLMLILALAMGHLFDNYDNAVAASAHEGRADSAESEEQGLSNRRRIKTFTCVVGTDPINVCIENAALDANRWLNNSPTARILEFRTDLSTGVDGTVYVITVYYLKEEQ